jgi:DNA-binding transcriptional regulator GbsR (MarR family)
MTATSITTETPAPAVSDFIEAFGRHFEREGIPRIAGRLTALLLVSQRPLSLDEIAASLGVSKASVSTDARRMEEKGFLQRSSLPGDRRDYYAVAPDSFQRMLEARIASLTRLAALCDSAQRLPVESDDVRDRLATWHEFVCAMQDTLSSLLRRWSGRRPSAA